MTKLILKRTKESITQFETPTGGTAPLVVSSKLRYNDSNSTFEFRRVKCFNRELRALGMGQWVSESEKFRLEENGELTSLTTTQIFDKDKVMFFDYLESKYGIKLTNKNKLKILNTKTNATH